MSTRKNVSFKNGRVLKAINGIVEGERSDFIEKCILYYLDAIEIGYATTEELEKEIKKYDKRVCILEERYTQVLNVLNDICEMTFDK